MHDNAGDLVKKSPACFAGVRVMRDKFITSGEFSHLRNIE